MRRFMGPTARIGVLLGVRHVLDPEMMRVPEDHRIEPPVEKLLRCFHEGKIVEGGIRQPHQDPVFESQAKIRGFEPKMEEGLILQ